jgi:hypothetical protein
MDAENDLQRGRSSSEEKESLTPAQSRRKAQNRAAYAPKAKIPTTIGLLIKSTVNGPFGSAKNDMLKT